MDRKHALLVGLALVAGTGCSTSSADLEASVRDLPGVVSVEAREVDGDDGLPFTSIPSEVEVRMRDDASEEQVAGVLAAYEDPIDDGSVDSLKLTLDDRRVTLWLGTGIVASEDMVEVMMVAADDPDLTSFSWSAFPVLPGVELKADVLTFAQLRDLMLRYQELTGVEYLNARSRGKLIEHVAGRSDDRFAARLELASAVDSAFGLARARVTDGAPLQLTVMPEDVAAARRFVSTHAVRGDTGRVQVSSMMSR